MDKLKLHTPDFTEANIAKLAELFPNCVTETQDAKGQIKPAIDFDLLKQELSGSIVEGPQERYQLNWPGKREALLTANAPIAKTLRPCREESVDFDTTQNLYIEGDNLDALKLLQETYLNKVKMIYIDPPYNTGNDFIYEDDFAEDTESYLERSNQKDDSGNRLVSNNESNGRFHSDWLSMIYSRLKLARNLLKDDGMIFISIDDNEQANLKRLCDEIFGDSNFIAVFCWQKFHSVKSNAVHNVSNSHEYLLAYAKNSEFITLNKLPMSEEALSVYKNPDNDPRGEWRTAPLTVSLLTGSRGESYKRTGKSTGLYDLVAPNGNIYKPTAGRCWISKETIERLDADKRIWWGKDGNAVPMQKIFLSEKGGTKTITTFWNHTEFGSNKKANEEIKLLFPENTGEATNFPTPKPTQLIKTLINITSTEDNDTILDFFSGSATTAHAVIEVNAEKQRKNNFILVQVPEVIDSDSYKSIAEIGKERIRRAGQKIKQEKATQPDIDQLDVGFRVLKVDSSNMNPVFYAPDQISQGDLHEFAENIRSDRDEEDLLFQVLLDWGVDLSLPITRETLAGKSVLFVDDNALAACFDNEGGITEDFVKQLAARQPLRVVFRDAGFASDSVKINVEQIFKLLSPSTDIKTL